MFETVHTCEDWWDGPRGGIADYAGQPHVFASEWRDLGTDPDGLGNTFRLSPVDEETFRLAMEAWVIWRRWETAFHQGIAPIETHPTLPGERERYEELQRLLAGQRVINPANAFRKAAVFRPRRDAGWNRLGFAPLEVQWKDPA